VRIYTRLVVLLCLAFAATAQATTWVEATGSAVISHGAVGAAREMATKDAMRQAMLQSGALVDMFAASSANVLTIESSSVAAAGTVEKVQILDEWVDNEVLHVRIRALVPADKIRAASPAARYRKKVVALQFDVDHRLHIQDLPNIELEWPRELLRRLESSGHYLGTAATQYMASTTRPGLRFDDPSVYTLMADKAGAQIVLSGVIRDMGVTESWLRNSRKIEVELFVHDGVSGARLARHKFSENVAASSYFPDGTELFSSADFMRTEYGSALDRILTRQVEMVEADLRQLPFTARVLKIDGKKIYFNAGTTSLVEMGDELMTYKLGSNPVLDRNNKVLGFQETPVATLSVVQIQPQFAIGELEIEDSKLIAGDLIRFGR